MARRFSTGLRNAWASGQSLADALADARLFVFTGAQPATADADATGVLLLPFTKDGVTYVDPVRASAKVTVTGGTAGGSNVLTSIAVGGCAFNLMGGPVAWTTSHSATADAIVAAINSTVNPFGITAAKSGTADVVLYAPYSLGDDASGLFVAATVGGDVTVTINGGSSAAFDGAGSPSAGAAVTAGYGLNFGMASSGVIQKTSDLWQATAIASGTAGWFRLVGGGSSYSGVSTTDVRIDGSIATSGGDLNVSSLTITAGTVQTISSFTITIPAT